MSSNRHAKSRRIAALVIAFAFVVAACGGGDSSSTGRLKSGTLASGGFCYDTQSDKDTQLANYPVPSPSVAELQTVFDAAAANAATPGGGAYQLWTSEVAKLQEANNLVQSNYSRGAVDAYWAQDTQVESAQGAYYAAGNLRESSENALNSGKTAQADNDKVNATVVCPAVIAATDSSSSSSLADSANSSSSSSVADIASSSSSLADSANSSSSVLSNNPVGPLSTIELSEPTNVSLVLSKRLATLSWSAPATQNGITSFHYEACLVSDGVCSISNSSSPFMHVMNMEPGDKIAFKVRAVSDNPVFASEYVEASSTYPAVAPPPAPPSLNAPTNLQAIAGDGQVTLTWETPTATETHRDMFVILKNGSLWAGVRGNSYTLDITNGVEYKFSLIAVQLDAEGTRIVVESNASNEVVVTPIAGTPAIACAKPTLVAEASSLDGNDYYLTASAGVGCVGYDVSINVLRNISIWEKYDADRIKFEPNTSALLKVTQVKGTESADSEPIGLGYKSPTTGTSTQCTYVPGITVAPGLNKDGYIVVTLTDQCSKVGNVFGAFLTGDGNYTGQTASTNDPSPVELWLPQPDKSGTYTINYYQDNSPNGTVSYEYIKPETGGDSTGLTTEVVISGIDNQKLPLGNSIKFEFGVTGTCASPEWDFVIADRNLDDNIVGRGLISKESGEITFPSPNARGNYAWYFVLYCDGMPLRYDGQLFEVVEPVATATPPAATDNSVPAAPTTSAVIADSPITQIVTVQELPPAVKGDVAPLVIRTDAKEISCSQVCVDGLLAEAGVSSGDVFIRVTDETGAGEWTWLNPADFTSKIKIGGGTKFEVRVKPSNGMPSVSLSHEIKRQGTIDDVDQSQIVNLVNDSSSGSKPWILWLGILFGFLVLVAIAKSMLSKKQPVISRVE